MSSDAVVGDQVSQLGGQLGHFPMETDVQSCCVADRRFPYHGKTIAASWVLAILPRPRRPYRRCRRSVYRPIHAQ